MKLFRATVAIAWLLVVWTTVQAIMQMGVDQAGATFIGDFSHPWRAQFNGDFSAHLLLMAAWIAYREEKLVARLVLAFAAILFGGAFSLAYVFVATYRGKGSVSDLLLGHMVDKIELKTPAD